ncbi:MAG: hypothetical protein ACI4MZ_04065 [Christensenellales bacterium]
MEYDETKKLEVEITKNDYVENKIESARKKRKSTIDALDVAIIPVAIGVFVSLGFLFAGIFKATSIVQTLAGISNYISLI